MIATLDAKSHIWNTKHWPHTQYALSNHYIRTYHPLTYQTTLTTCPVRTVLSLYLIPPPTYRIHSTDHLSSTYTPITILDANTHIWNQQHWPHDRYVHSYHYIRSQHPLMKHTSRTTSPLHTVLSLYYIPPSTYGTHSPDHMSSTYSSITLLDPITRIRNTQHWPHVQYVQPYHFVRSHQSHTEHTTLTTCPVYTALSLC